MTYQRKKFNEFVFDVIDANGLVVAYFKYEKVARRFIKTQPEEEQRDLQVVKTLRSSFEGNFDYVISEVSLPAERG